MACPRCGALLEPGRSACEICGHSLDATSFQTGHDASTYVAPASSGRVDSAAVRARTAGRPHTQGVRSGITGPLAPGTAFGSRYHLTRLLGIGGMGAVYQAWDEELGVSVAVKVIRPEITADPAAARDLERRFKRELLLARQVTHKNVVRIHDLGEIDGIKYLTMPYIQGNDLATILRKEGTLPIDRTLSLARQIASGLQAAHEAGVVHRDLKPANVMIDADDQAVIMDFGISRSVSGAGATVAGAVIGTLEYMAPEQAMAQPIDHRADIYAFGLVMRDMLVGPRNTGGAETAVSELMSRLHAPMPSIRTIDATIPEGVDDLITRCTEPDATARYQMTRDLVADLEVLDPSSRKRTGAVPPIVRRDTVPGRSSEAPRAPTFSSGTAVKLTAALLLAVAVLGGGWMLRGRFNKGADPTPVASEGKPVALALVPLRNGTRDASLDWLGPSLADMMAADIGQSDRLRLVSSERVFQLLRDLRIGNATELDAGALRRIAEFSSADTVAAGRFETVGDQIRINVTLHSGGREPVILRASAAGENDLLRAARELAGGIRENLALPPEALRDLQSRVIKPSSTSVQALRHYTEGVQLARQGEHLEATKRFHDATRADPSFALAFSKLALSLGALGRAGDAESASRRALALSEQLPAEERELIVGTNARVLNDVDTAIESFERLSDARPADVQLQFELAELYESKGALDKARDAYARIIAADPRHGEALYAAGRVAIQRQDFEGALPSLTSALSIAIQLDKPESRARVLQALGIAYRSLGKYDDALAHFEQSLAIKKQIGDKRGLAASLSEIAYIHDLQGRPDRAVQSYTEALEIRRALGDRRGVGITLANLGASHLDRGRYPQALQALREALQIHREIGDEAWQARCLNSIGDVYFATAQYEESRTNLERALELREKARVPGVIALTLTSLGDVSTRLGEYDRAQSQYLRAIDLWRNDGDRRGAAIGSYAMGTLLEQQGRYGAAAEAKGDALKSIREMKEQSFSLADILSGYGSTMSVLGRKDEASRALDEALRLARDLKNETLVAQTLNFQGDLAYFAGDLGSARSRFDEARQAAEHGVNRYLVLRSKVNMAKIAAEQGRQSAVADLRTLVREVDSLGLKPLAAEGSLYLGTALLRTKRVPEARAELESALARNERLGAKAFIARSHQLLAAVSESSGDRQQADVHAQQATQIIEEMKKESRSDTIATLNPVR